MSTLSLDKQRKYVQMHQFIGSKQLIIHTYIIHNIDFDYFREGGEKSLLQLKFSENDKLSKWGISTSGSWFIQIQHA